MGVRFRRLHLQVVRRRRRVRLRRQIGRTRGFRATIPRHSTGQDRRLSRGPCGDSLRRFRIPGVRRLLAPQLGPHLRHAGTGEMPNVFRDIVRQMEEG